MFRSCLIAGCALSALALAAAPAVAQETLTWGRAAQGELTATDPQIEDGNRYDEWGFSTRQGQRVELTMTAETFDAYLEVWAADGTAVGPNWFDDDSLGGTDARVRFTAPAGDWIVRARGFDAEAAGAYELRLAERPPAPRAPRPSALRLGQTATGELSSRDPETDEGERYDAWRIRARQGERILITLTSDAFDPIVRVGSEAGGLFSELAVNDDDGRSLNSRLIFEAPSAGDYVVRVSAVGDGEGAYSLAAAQAPAESPVQTLQIGQSIEAELTETDGLNARGAHADVYRFEGAAGQRVRVDMTSQALDAYLELSAEADRGTILAEDDDGGEAGTDARLTYTLPADGAYLIHARAFAPGGLGAYRLEIGEAAPERPAEALAFGARIEGQITEDDPTDGDGRGYDAYVFSGVAGQRIQAILRSGDFDSFLRVGSAEGEFAELASDDDGLGRGFDSRLNFTLPEDGDYVLWASALSDEESGLYSVELIDRGPEPGRGSLLVGSRVRGTLSEADSIADDESWFDTYEFEAKAGETLEIVMASNAFDAFVVVGRDKANGQFEALGSDDDSLSDTHARLEWEAPADGTYVIRAGSFGVSESGAYVLSVTPKP